MQTSCLITFSHVYSTWHLELHRTSNSVASLSTVKLTFGFYFATMPPWCLKKTKKNTGTALRAKAEPFHITFYHRRCLRDEGCCIVCVHCAIVVLLLLWIVITLFFLSTSRFVNMPDGKLVGNIIARSVYFVHECADCHVGRHWSAWNKPSWHELTKGSKWARHGWSHIRYAHVFSLSSLALHS